MIGSIYEYATVIRESHLDTFGHVNNAKYLEILEEARWDLVTQNGYGLDEVMRRRIGPTILEITLKFQRELRNRQRIVVKTWMESYVGKIGRVIQQIVDPDGNLCCEALFTIGLFDLGARRLIAPTPEWLRALGLNASDLPPAPAR